MTIEELRKTAKNMGYNIIPINVKEKLVPCLCGSKKREHWSSYIDGTWHEVLKCSKCGRKGAPGSTEAEARRNWNIMIKEEEKRWRLEQEKNDSI